MKFLSLNDIRNLQKFPKYQDFKSEEIEHFSHVTILAVSHRWESPHDPDPLGEQFLEVKKLFNDFPDHSLFYDYSSLPQHPRNENEEDIFKRDLRKLDILFSTNKVLILEKGSHDYHTRAWCFFEWCLSLGKQYGNTKLFPELQGLRKLQIDADEFMKTGILPRDFDNETDLSLIHCIKNITFDDDYVKVSWNCPVSNKIIQKDFQVEDVYYSRHSGFEVENIFSYIRRMSSNMDPILLDLSMFLRGIGCSEDKILGFDTILADNVWYLIIFCEGVDRIFKLLDTLLWPIRERSRSDYSNCNKLIKFLKRLRQISVNGSGPSFQSLIKKMKAIYEQSPIEPFLRDSYSEKIFPGFKKSKHRIIRFLSCLNVTNGKDIKFLMDKLMLFYKISVAEAIIDFVEIFE